MTYQNRIVETGVKPASDYLAHPFNYRIHPSEQQAALEGILREGGWIQNVVVSARSGYLIDGHQRVLSALKLGEDTPVPYVAVDLTEDEERLMLTVFDPLAAMAAHDRTQMTALLTQVSSQDDGVKALLARLAESNQPVVEREAESGGARSCPTCGRKLRKGQDLTLQSTS
jgi:hypothetical protein